MRTYNFEMVLDAPTTESDDERLFDCFEGRVFSAVVNGVAMLYLHLVAASMDDAVRKAVEKIRGLNLLVRRIELDPDVFLADAA